MQKFVVATVLAAAAVSAAEITCVVTNKKADTTECAADATVVDVVPAGTFTTAKNFAKFTVDTETCDDIAGSNPCYTALAIGAAATAEEAACIAAKGANALCPAKAGEECAVDAAVKTCVDKLVCVPKMATDKTGTCQFKGTLTGFTAGDIEELQMQLDEVFKAAPAPGPNVQQDPPVNNCEGITAKVDMFYPKRAFATMTAQPSQACIDQVKDQVVLAVQDATDVCLKACGTDNCKCQPGQECVMATPAEGQEADKQGNCDAGLECVKQEDGKYLCNSGVYASAALAVAAAVLAVIF